MARFAVELVYGDDEDARLAVRPAHRDYLATLVERGALLVSGPYADQTGALLVYEAADEDELREILAADPYTSAGVIAETRVHEWQTLLGTWV
ncbi:YciI family protein [Saccharothrix sp. NRRL B-16314]|uniref:YciI family protein n=1 Tax=Saccharothrix sp. NRRL B-16314 TaxID=1463825 RepID=UPI00052453CD|nr:YciI family protein [Saccharothrix sp. NRRL B-16314]